MDRREQDELMRELIAGVQALTGLANKASDEGIKFNIQYLSSERMFISQYTLPSAMTSVVFDFNEPPLNQVKRKDDLTEYAKEALEEISKLLATRDKYIPRNPYDFY